jgi:hypothetical protein
LFAPGSTDGKTMANDGYGIDDLLAGGAHGRPEEDDDRETTEAGVLGGFRSTVATG